MYSLMNHIMSLGRAPTQESATSQSNPIQMCKTPANAQLSTDMFSASLLATTLLDHPLENVVYSPISIQLLLAFIYIGATDMTAHELRCALRIPADKNTVSKIFNNVLKSQLALNVDLNLANKLYHNHKLQVNPSIREIGRQYFHMDVEAIPFSPPGPAANRINRWIEEKTHKHIRNLIRPDMLGAGTNMLLVNAIYFKGRWEKEFANYETSAGNFTNGRQARELPIMFALESFRFADFPTLGARIVEMKYKDSDLSMLIILPYGVNDLAALEQSISSVLLQQLYNQLRPELVALRLPRFRIEFNIDMIEPLKKLNIRTIFTPYANLSALFVRPSESQIDQIEHRAFIEVNESGTTAAAATYARVVPLSAAPRVIDFRADHPFMFAIRSPEAIYFIGHVVEPWLYTVY